MRLTAAMPLIGLLALSACATPREACIRDAAAPWRSAVAERERIAQDLARGYTYEPEFQRVDCQKANRPRLLSVTRSAVMRVSRAWRRPAS